MCGATCVHGHAAMQLSRNIGARVMAWLIRTGKDYFLALPGAASNMWSSFRLSDMLWLIVVPRVVEPVEKIMIFKPASVIHSLLVVMPQLECQL